MMIHDEGQPTSQETRTFDVKSGTTLVLRTKEGAKDYRFMPEPDLPPLILNEDVFGEGMDLSTYLRDRLPELPEHARERLVGEYGLSPYLAGVLTADPPAIKMFEEAVNAAISQLESSCDGIDDRWKREIPETVANLLCNELYGLVREHETQRLIVEGIDGGEASVRFSKVTGTQLGEVAALNQEGNISNTMAKQLLRILYSEEEEGASPRLVAQDRGIKLILNIDDLKRVCQIVIDENPDEVEKYKLGGKFATKMTKFFLGKAMSASCGNAHPERLIEVLDEMLQEIVPPSDES
jgi:aspartyl-tRNA(Asn)/glutamyl-tRNA(Gln) amidotransferase subunit B